jgi:hypothetical protein
MVTISPCGPLPVGGEGPSFEMEILPLPTAMPVGSSSPAVTTRLRVPSGFFPAGVEIRAPARAPSGPSSDVLVTRTSPRSVT